MTGSQKLEIILCMSGAFVLGIASGVVLTTPKGPTQHLPLVTAHLGQCRADLDQATASFQSDQSLILGKLAECEAKSARFQQLASTAGSDP